MTTPDEILTEIMRITESMRSTPEGSQRDALEARREELRATARLLTDIGRPPSNLRAELVAVEEQLADLDDTGIKPALNENYRVITDPAAYRRRINETIVENNAPDKGRLEARRAELLEALAAQAVDDA